ncbi:MAG TPA: methionine adenosyltransferase [Methylomirabilota bacterium]|nr:methionine adenosyltransferase [Methylomirabilota bacterium]
MRRRAAVVVEALPGPPVGRRRVEIVERKGLGHPDTICDSLVEAIALALNQMYLERLGTVVHYNIDKALLIAGQCRKGFGGGKVMRPMEFIVGDRATFEADGHKLPVQETAVAAVERWLAGHLPLVLPHLRTRVALAPGSAELTGIFASTAPDVLSNDTSGASGYAPLSETEAIVLGVERFLNGPGFKARFPDTGHDVKVFGRREDDRLSLTVAMPLLAGATPSEAAYFRRKEEILAALAQQSRGAPLSLEWRLNNLDVPGHGSDGVYLTLTGTSAEDADSGQVGRGNRANGLIAFVRPTGGEAAAGKNAFAHAGKVYSVLSHRLAQRIHAAVPDLAEVYVHLAARIGEPIDHPWIDVQVVLHDGVALADVEAAIRATVEAEAEGFAEFRVRLGRGEFPVC